MKVLATIAHLALMLNKNPDPYVLAHIVKAGAQELGLDGVNIRIVPLELKNLNGRREDSSEILAYVTGRNGWYTIHLRDNIEGYKLLEVLSHELIHVQQYEQGKLKLYNNGVNYDGKFYEKAKYIPHETRAWERDAYRKGKELARKIKSLLK